MRSGRMDAPVGRPRSAITEIAVRILIEIDDIRGPAIDREITGTAGGNIF